MPYFYRIDPTVDVIFIRHIGWVSTEDLCNQIREIKQRGDFQPRMNLLYDLRQEIPPDIKHMRTEGRPHNCQLYQAQLKNLFGSFENIKIAYIVKEGLDKYFDSVLNLMLEIDTIKSDIFFNINTAKDWLGIPSYCNVENTLENVIYAFNHNPNDVD